MDDYGDTAQWNDRGGYMNAKKRKQLHQYDEEQAVINETAAGIFSGVAIFVNGYTDVPVRELRQIMLDNGGVYHGYLCPQKTTHVIASNMPFAKQVLTKDRIVTPNWITDSLAAASLLDWRDYELYPTANGQQPSRRLKPDTARILPAAIGTAVNLEQGKHDDAQGEHTLAESRNSAHATTAGLIAAAELPVEDARNPEFVKNFFGKSRLHHLATWKSEFQQLVGDVQAQLIPNFSGVERLRAFAAEEPSTSSTSSTSGNSCVVMHIDMDCFFVSVGLLHNPSLRGKSVCVCHARTGRGRREDEPLSAIEKPENQNSSMSEISSCSYEARTKGVKNGMMLGYAKSLCPELQTLPYNFEEYNRISKLMYHNVAEYTHDIEAISCDELYIDCTELLKATHATPEQFATLLRREIFDRTKCPASCGIGPNKLLARLATTRAKPNGQFFLNRDADEHAVLDYLAKLSVRDLPGVGRETDRKFNNLNIATCGDLRRRPVGVLQSTFGTFLGKKLHDFSRGIDTRPVQNNAERKSISVELNHGIRLTTMQEFEQFFNQVCIELERRMLAAHVQGIHITLKLLVRRPDAPIAPEKFMGHGKCNAFTKSEQVKKPIDSKTVLYKIGMQLFKSLLEEFGLISDLRGVGLHVGKLICLSEPIMTGRRQKTIEIEDGGGIMKFLKPRNDVPAGTDAADAAGHGPSIAAKNLLRLPTISNFDDFAAVDVGDVIMMQGNLGVGSRKAAAVGDVDADGIDVAEFDDMDAEADDVEAGENGLEERIKAAERAAQTKFEKSSCSNYLKSAKIFGFNPLDRPDANGKCGKFRAYAMQQLLLATRPEQLYEIYGRKKIDKIRNILTKHDAENKSPSSEKSSIQPLSPPKFADDVQQRAYENYFESMKRKIDANLLDCPPYDLNVVKRATSLKLRYQTDNGKPPSFFAVRDVDTIENDRLDAAKPGVKPRQRLMASSWYYEFPLLTKRQNKLAAHYNTLENADAAAEVEHEEAIENVPAGLDEALPAVIPAKPTNENPLQRFRRVSATQHLREVAAILNDDSSNNKNVNSPKKSLVRDVAVAEKQPTITQAMGALRMTPKPTVGPQAEPILSAPPVLPDTPSPVVKLERRSSTEFSLHIEELLADSNPSQLVRDRMAQVNDPPPLPLRPFVNELDMQAQQVAAASAKAMPNGSLTAATCKSAAAAVDPAENRDEDCNENILGTDLVRIANGSKSSSTAAASTSRVSVGAPAENNIPFKVPAVPPTRNVVSPRPAARVSPNPPTSRRKNPSSKKDGSSGSRRQIRRMQSDIMQFVTKKNTVQLHHARTRPANVLSLDESVCIIEEIAD